MVFHVPVMAPEVVAGLVGDPQGIYVDATAGGGGHSRAILDSLGSRGRLIAIDRDPEAVVQVRQALVDDRVVVVGGRFGDLRQVLARQGVDQVAGVLFDLGVSSHQIDEAGRGFSYQQDGPLDMRMEQGEGMSAADLIAQSSMEELATILDEYGEEGQARRIARAIGGAPVMATTADLRRAVESTRPRHLPKTLARVFQALRIAVNRELEQLALGLEAGMGLLGPGGRLGVIAYHSLEDRLVKQTFAPLLRGCTCPPAVVLCVCGGKASFAKVAPKTKKASLSEVGSNRRARSASLRLYEKLGG
ncbi:MAG: 16S rRNA (cytosine(1402)-N(4))-methyltransferase RsmH [Candidatus Latescibacteria bacterium]|nr:16S rRNA (cytosine(1402)-N(4))-methyltransferase RsmH [Candidatus Latescibacterota bacterium]